MRPADSLVIAGEGAVSACGWGVGALLDAVRHGVVPPTSEAGGLHVRRVPPPMERPAWLAHPRLRRTSPVAQFATAAALEALGPERVAEAAAGRLRAGIVCTLMNGCVIYSGRFFDEVTRDPATASPILFPETVFNAPAGHLAALLGLSGPVTTLVGDAAQCFDGLAMARGWILTGELDGCLVVGAEEFDPLSAGALGMLCRGATAGEGAAAVYLERGDGEVRVQALPEAVPLSGRRTREAAAREVRAALPDAAGALLVDDACGAGRADAATQAAWRDHAGPRWSPRLIAGEAMGAAAAMQLAVAAAALRAGLHDRAAVVATGTDAAAAGALLTRTAGA